MEQDEWFVGMGVTPVAGQRNAGEPGIIEQIQHRRAKVIWTEPGGDIDARPEWYEAHKLNSREK